MRQKRWFMVIALGAALVTGLPIGAAARKPKERVSAIINGHKLKLRQKQLTAGRTGDGVSIVGGMKPHHLNQRLKSLVVTCAEGLAGGVFPVAGQFCAIGYSETKVAVNPTYKQWQGESDAVQVTFESFDGTRLEGTFQGTLQPMIPNAGYGPLTVQNGKFTILFTN